MEKVWVKSTCFHLPPDLDSTKVYCCCFVKQDSTKSAPSLQFLPFLVLEEIDEKMHKNIVRTSDFLVLEISTAGMPQSRSSDLFETKISAGTPPESLAEGLRK